MVELGHQFFLVLLDPLPLGYVNVDANDPLLAPLVIVAYETTRLDPTHLATRTHNPILEAILVPACTKRVIPEVCQPPHVIRVHASQALAPSDLGRALGKAMDGRIAF